MKQVISCLGSKFTKRKAKFYGLCLKSVFTDWYSQFDYLLGHVSTPQ